MPLKTKPFDEAAYLTTSARVTGYLQEAMATGDPAVIQHALGAVARATGMTKVARAAGLDRVNLYRALSSPHTVKFGTVIRVFDALGFGLKITKPRKPRTRRAKMPVVIAGTRKAVKPGRTGER